MESPAENSQTDLESALNYIHPDKLSYDEWIEVGMALKDAGCPCSMWDTWSKDDVRYHPGECKRKWNSFSGKGVTKSTIYKMASDRGYSKGRPNSSMGWGDPIQYDGDDYDYGSNNQKNVAAKWNPSQELIEYLKALFNDDDIIGYVTYDVFQDEDGKWKPRKGSYSRTAGELITALEKNPDDITNAIGTYKKEAGAWIRINPLDGKGVKNDNVVAFKYALVESDTLSIQDQDILYRKLRLPIATLVNSGGKSIHALIRIDANDNQEYEERVAYLHKVLSDNGVEIDKQNKNPSRLSRMPGVIRNGNKQHLLATDIGCKSWNEWKTFIEHDYISDSDKSFLALFKPLDAFQEKRAEWIIEEWIPKKQITLLVGEGGIGKTSFWINLLAGLSSGQATILDIAGSKKENSSLTNFSRIPMKVAFLSTEDSVSEKLLPKLRKAGANLSNILTVDLSADKEGALKDFKFGSPRMSQFIRDFHPAVCVFDPLQGFIPAELNMGSRNAMRDCMSPFIGLGEECGTTFVIVCHSNKRKGASGRFRVADSADIWDISRSVIMAGTTQDRTTRYLSNEKNNYGPLQESVLYTMDDQGKMVFEGLTWKKDADFVSEALSGTNKKDVKLEACKTFILENLGKEYAPTASNELTTLCSETGYGFNLVKRAKSELKDAGKIDYRPVGKGGQWVVWRRDDDTDIDQAVKPNSQFKALPDDTDVPF